MSDEPAPRTSRVGAVLVALSVGASAVGVVGWHLSANRGAPAMDASGFDMSAVSEPTPARSSAPEPAEQRTGLTMVKGGDGLTLAGPEGPAAGASAQGGASPAVGSPKERAALTFKEATEKHQKTVTAFIIRMQKKHPSILQYGRDWAASPELRALRDQYWKDKDPVKFAYGVAKSDDFAKLLKKYAADPGMRDAVMSGIKEAPPDLLSAAGGVFQNDGAVRALVTTVQKAAGLPSSLTAFLGGGDEKPDTNKVMSDIMNSDEVKKAMKNQQAPVSLGR